MTIDTEYKQVENLHDFSGFYVNFYFGDKDVAYKVIQLIKEHILHSTILVQHNTPHLTCEDKTQVVQTPEINENIFIDEIICCRAE